MRWAMLSQHWGILGRCTSHTKETHSGQNEVWDRQSGAAGEQAGPGGVAALAREAVHPFQVLDHRNLEYLKSAKHLNSCQVWFIFTHFHFKVCYIPGAKNIKADVLSCQFHFPAMHEEPVLILDRFSHTAWVLFHRSGSLCPGRLSSRCPPKQECPTAECSLG